MARHPTEPTEASPLLVERDEDSTPPSRYWFQVQRPRTIALLLSLLILILATSGSLMVVPTTRILEDIICHHHYDVQRQGDTIDERLCKNDAIQSQVAYLNGLINMMEAIVGLIVAFPYGILSDRIGRKPVFFICMIGSFLDVSYTYMILHFWHAIPVRLIVLAPVFMVIGGGYTVVVAVLYSIAADVESDAHRASAFFLMSCAFLIAGFLGPAVSSKMMQNGSPWAPLLLAYIAIPIGSSIMFFIPETLQVKGDVVKDTSHEERTLTSIIKSQLQHALSHSAKYFTMLKSVSVVLVLLTWLIHFPAFLARGQFFVQYFSKRFDWQLAETGYLLSVRGVVSIFVLLVALPGLSKLLLSPSLPFQVTVSRKDLILAQFSALFTTIGAVFMAGPNVPTVLSGMLFSTLGDGLSALCRSLATSFVDSRHTSSLYVLIGVVESIGMTFAGPALAYFFTIGMKLKGLWLGLPFFWLASISALSTICLCFVRLPAGSVKLSEIDAADSQEESTLIDGAEV